MARDFMCRGGMVKTNGPGPLISRSRHRHEMVGEKVDVPVAEKAAWFTGVMPGRRDEVAKRLPIKQGFALLAW